MHNDYGRSPVSAPALYGYGYRVIDRVRGRVRDRDMDRVRDRVIADLTVFNGGGNWSSPTIIRSSVVLSRSTNFTLRSSNY